MPAIARNMWGTDRAMVTADEFCPGCEREVPGHYEGCPDVGVRKMGSEEYGAWYYALWLARRVRAGVTTADEAIDRLAELANDAEDRSIRYERRGMHSAADMSQRLAELYDATRVLVK